MPPEPTGEAFEAKASPHRGAVVFTGDEKGREHGEQAQGDGDMGDQPQRLQPQRLDQADHGADRADAREGAALG